MHRQNATEETTHPARAEDTLVPRLLARDERAWRELDQTHGPAITRAIRRVIGRFARVASREDVEEVRASFYCQLLADDLRKLRTFDATRGHSLGGWLTLLATHAAWDHLRSVREGATRTVPADLELIGADGPDAIDVCERRQRAELLARLVDELSAKDREFLELYLGDELAPEEVAARMNISVKTVYSKKHKIRARLEAMVAA